MSNEHINPGYLTIDLFAKISTSSWSKGEIEWLELVRFGGDPAQPNDGWTFVASHQVPLPNITPDDIRQGCIKSYQQQQAQKRADSEQYCALIQEKINELLALPAPEAKPKVPNANTDDWDDIL